MYSTHRLLLLLLLVPLLPQSLPAIPAWARRYNMNCSGCHYPAVPRLNATGILFKWAGYRMPDALGEKIDVQKIEDYLAVRAKMQYSVTRSDAAGVEESGISTPSTSLFLAGPFGKQFGGYVEFERLPGGAVDLNAEVTATWGKESAFYGLRFGAGHLLYGGALAGFDRPTGIVAPLAMSDPTSSVVPFAFGGDAAGAELFYVFDSKDRLSFRAMNSRQLTPGGGGELAPGKKVDLIFSNQYMWDAKGSGITALAYLGSFAGLDPALPDQNATFTRVGLTANKIYQNFEVLGGYVYSSDRDIPAAAAPGGRTSLNGTAWWLSGQYFWESVPLAVFTRYEYVRPDQGVTDNALQRWVVGGVMPVSLPENLRLALDYVVDTPQAAAGTRRQRIVFELMMAF